MKKLNIAIVGLGNIGSYLYKYLKDNKKILAEKCKTEIFAHVSELGGIKHNPQNFSKDEIEKNAARCGDKNAAERAENRVADTSNDEEDIVADRALLRRHRKTELCRCRAHPPR